MVQPISGKITVIEYNFIANTIDTVLLETSFVGNGQLRCTQESCKLSS